jgi:hypothetical protein
MVRASPTPTAARHRVERFRIMGIPLGFSVR